MSMTISFESRGGGSKRGESNDPYKLRGLDQAIYLLVELCGGCEKSDLIGAMHGDKQLVDLWMNFLQHNHWIARGMSSANPWVLTDKGKQWIGQIRRVVLPHNINASSNM